ncbi:MAG: DUF1631 family protein [Nevskia sp.]|nr:DUF1631 family protein [Nevskia sp.]
MTATVHSLFGDSPQERGEQPAAPAHPLVADLREAAVGVLDELMGRMFDSADDTLFEMGEKSSSDEERRRYFDAMRLLRLDRGKVTAAFAGDIVRGFAPLVTVKNRKVEFDLDSLSIQPTEELEEKIAVTNMAAKAEGLFKSSIWELERQLEFATRELGVPMSPLALGPNRICEAFVHATSSSEAGFHTKLVVYKLFDRVVISDLGRVYTAALAVLEKKGIGPSRRQAQTAVPAGIPGGGAGYAGGAPSYPAGSIPMAGFPPAQGAPPGAGSMQGPGPAQGPVQGMGYAPPMPGFAPVAGMVQGPAVAQIQDLLRGFGLDQASVQRAGTPVGAELAGVLQTLLAGAATPTAEGYTQRLMLAGRMFDDILAEPMLPDPLRPVIERLRYPVYKTALSDASFFADQGHPLRKLLGDVLELAISAQTSEAAQAQLREALRIAASVQDGPALGADNLRAAKPVSDGEVEGFLAQLRQQTQTRREEVLVRIRRQIAQELELQTLGREVPAPAMSLLRRGVGPLMAVRLLRNGRASESYRQAQGLMTGLLESLELEGPAGAEARGDRERLLAKIAAELADVGMPTDKIQTLLDDLREVYQLLDGVAAGSAPDSGPVQAEAQAQADPDALSEREERLLMSEFEHSGGAEEPAPAPPRREPKPAASHPAPDALSRATMMDHLRRVLATESWFRVYDAEHNQTRWLKLNSFYPDQDSVTFTGFDESLKLSIRASLLVEHLVSGQSEPINPDEAARAALELLRLHRPRS